MRLAARARRLGLLAALLLPRLAVALEPEAPLDRYGVDAWRDEQGLPQGTVTAIAQSPDGFLWLGTQEGLVRFDGTRFRVFDRRSVPEMPSAVVDALVVAPDGALWIALDGGLLRYADGRFRRVATDPLVARPGGTLAVERSGAVWFGVPGGGAIRIDSAGASRVFTVAEGLPSNVVSAIGEGADGAIWIGTPAGIARLAGGALRTFTVRDGLPSDDVQSLAFGAHEVVAGTARGVASGDAAGFHRAGGEGGALADVDAIAIAGDGTIWAGSRDGGLSRIRPGKPAESAGAAIPQGVLSLLLDREGSLWAGTAADGLRRVRDSRIRTITFGRGPELTNAVVEDPDGALWTTTPSGLVRWTADGRTTVLTAADGLPRGEVQGLAEGRDGDLWVATPGGIARLHGGRVIARFGDEEGVTGQVGHVFVDGAGAVWASPFARGIRRLEGGHFVPVPGLASLDGQTVLQLASGPDGTTWMGTLEGGIVSAGAGGVVRYGVKDGLPSATIAALLVDADGTVWAGTPNGIARIRGGRIASMSSVNGLDEDDVLAIASDGADNLWLGGDFGITRVARASLEAVADGRAPTLRALRFGRIDGMASSECNFGGGPAVARTRAGDLVFTTVAGLVRVDPKHLGHAPPPPPALVESVRVDREPVRISDAVVLPPGNHRLEIEYTAVTFLSARQLRFRYRLDGFDPDWVQVGDARDAEYTNVPPGRYRFRVSVCNPDDECNDEGGLPQIVVPKPLVDSRSLWLAGVSIALLVVGGCAQLASWVRGREAALRAEAHVDPVTGLGNRREFEAALTQAWSAAEAPITLVLFEVELRGGLGGAEAALSRVAEDVLAANPQRSICRLLGGTFALLLPGVDPEAGREIAEKVRSVAKSAAGGPGVFVGCAFTDSGRGPAIRILELADAALGQARRLGGERVSYATEEGKTVVVRRP